MIGLYPRKQFIGILCVPIMSVCMNKWFTRLLDTPKTQREFWLCILIKLIMDVLSIVLQQELLWHSTRQMKKTLLERLEQANIRCGVPLPGKLATTIRELHDDNSKLQDFLFVLPIVWATIVSFGINIMMIEPHPVYPLRSTQLVSILSLTYFMIKTVDQTLYEKTKPDPTAIIQFKDKMYVWFKLSLGCSMIIDHEQQKSNRMNQQQRIQRVVVVILNLIITIISLLNNDIKMIQSFGSITWMLACMADHVKSLQYYTYMDKLFSTINILEKNRLICGWEAQTLNVIDYVIFKNAYFGYYVDDDLTQMNLIVKNLSIIFQTGVVYYLEAENGIGKSTILKMFSSNLHSGEIRYGSKNRNELTFENQRRSIIHYVQSSEYTPNLTLEEMQTYRNKDIELENALGLQDIWEKGMSELSGGMKKRFMIFLALISAAPIVLLDETLAELSTQSETAHEDGGWLGTVLKTLVECENSKKKIIVLIGHDLLHRIPSQVIKLNLKQTAEKTTLSYF